MTYDAEVLEDDPLLYWKLNDSTTSAVDSTGNGYTGTYSGDYVQSVTTRLPAGTGTAFNEAGAKNGVVKIDTAALGFLTNQGTFEFWYEDVTYVNPITPSVGAYYAAILQYASTAVNEGNDFYIGWESNARYFRMGTDNGAVNFSTGGPNPYSDIQTPKHVAIVWDGVAGTALLYVNGVLADSASDSDLIYSIPAGGYLHLCQEPDTETGGYQTTQCFAATISNVAIYQDKLSAARILAHWEAHVDDLYAEYHSAMPVIAAAADVIAPTVSDWSTGSVLPTDDVSFTVSDNDMAELDVEIWITFAGGAELAYADGASTTNYQVTKTDNTTDWDFTVVRSGAGWTGNFTVTVRARDSSNLTIATQAYVLDTTDLYPPHMDPYT
mgnify:FL=1